MPSIHPAYTSLNAYHLKWVAMLAMVADHVGWAFYGHHRLSAEWLHFIGRLVAPLMAYFLAVGFRHTQNVRAYAWRLGIFALISQPAYVLYNASIIGDYSTTTLLHLMGHGNVLFGLLLSLIALIVLRSSLQGGIKAVLLLGVALLMRQMDYGMGMLFWVLLFYYFYQHRWLVVMYVATLPICYVLIYGFNQTVGLGFMHYGMILTGLLIYLYNGEKGSTWGGRYLFYGFYPVHLLVLAVVRWLV